MPATASAANTTPNVSKLMLPPSSEILAEFPLKPPSPAVPPRPRVASNPALAGKPTNQTQARGPSKLRIAGSFKVRKAADTNTYLHTSPETTPTKPSPDVVLRRTVSIKANNPSSLRNSLFMPSSVGCVTSAVSLVMKPFDP
jgi:hypothetical protein